MSSPRHSHHEQRVRRSSHAAQASDGLISSLLLPLRGAGIGWAVLFGGFGIVWMIMIEVLAWFWMVTFPLFWMLVAVFYTLALRFATACFNGARAGDDEPDLTDVPSGGALSWLAPGGIMTAYLLGAIYIFALVFDAVSPGTTAADLESSTRLSLGALLLTCLVFAPFAASLGLAAARGSAVAMFAFPSVFRLVGASGGRYVVPLVIGLFAGSAPFQVVTWAQQRGGTWAFLLTATTMMITGYAFGAIGASMGWLARVDPDAADVLDG